MDDRDVAEEMAEMARRHENIATQGGAIGGSPKTPYGMGLDADFLQPMRENLTGRFRIQLQRDRKSVV